MLCHERPFENLSACILDAQHDGPCHFARGKSLARREVDIYRHSPRGQSFTFVRTMTLPGNGSPITREAMSEAWTAAQPEIPGQTTLDVQ
jgi:hypothetical protein